MNAALERFAREHLQVGLHALDKKFDFFKRIYCFKEGESIEAVVDAIAVDKLDWACTQVDNTLKKGSQG